jgi:hypothetical protein
MEAHKTTLTKKDLILRITAAVHNIRPGEMTAEETTAGTTGKEIQTGEVMKADIK